MYLYLIQRYLQAVYLIFRAKKNFKYGNTKLASTAKINSGIKTYTFLDKEIANLNKFLLSSISRGL